MRCNGFDVIDLGVMVPAETIVERACRENADIVGLSGLITPSLEEMCNVARLMARKGLTIPLFIGGATTSGLHTAIKIAPLYQGPVIHTRDAAQMPGRVREFTDPLSRPIAERRLRDEQQHMRDAATESSRMLSLTEARALKPRCSYGMELKDRLTPGAFIYRWDIDSLRTLINWRAFLAAWKLDASFASLAPDCSRARHAGHQSHAPSSQMQAKAMEAQRLLIDADEAIAFLAAQKFTVKGMVNCLPASSTPDDEILIDTPEGRCIIPTLRQQQDENGQPRMALADFIAPADSSNTPNDHIGIFAVSTGQQMQQLIDKIAADDEYKGLVYRTVADRLAEAATEATHRQALIDWNYTAGVNLNEPDIELKSIRPAIGYPSLPDQSLMFILERMLDFRKVDMQTTESGALNPPASTAGLIILNPAARYFILGKTGRDQQSGYLSRHPLQLPDQSRFLQWQ